MNIDYTVTALMFPAIPLIMSVYSNRFHTLSGLIRKIHDEYVFEKHTPPEWKDQLLNLNNRVNVLKDKFLRLKRKRFSGRNLPPVSRLRKQIQELEIKQMTTPLTTDKERALVDEIGSLQNKIKEHDNLIETDTEVLEARDKFREAEKVSNYD